MPDWNWQKIKQNKEHPEAELQLFENYLLSSSKLSSKIVGDVLKNIPKTSASVLMRLLMTIKMRPKMKKKSHICNINGPRPTCDTEDELKKRVAYKKTCSIKL